MGGVFIYNGKEVKYNTNMENITKVVEKYTKLLDFERLNETLELTGNKDLAKISKKTIQNIAKWSLNRCSEKEIASNLELSEKQFKTLCQICPTIIYVMQESKELAEIVLVGSLFQRAIGGQRVYKTQAVKVNLYNEHGVRIGEDYKLVEVWEELPPDSNLLKFLAEKKLSEKLGDKQIDADKEVVDTINGLNEKQLNDLEKELNASKGTN